MSAQKNALRRIADAVNAGDPHSIEALFSDAFVLHDPNAPLWPRGREGVRRMVASMVGVTIAPLDMVEEGDRVCVRWAFSGVRDGEPIAASCVAIYRFAGGAIVEDWGVTARAPWP